MHIPVTRGRGIITHLLSKQFLRNLSDTFLQQSLLPKNLVIVPKLNIQSITNVPTYIPLNLRPMHTLPSPKVRSMFATLQHGKNKVPTFIFSYSNLNLKRIMDITKFQPLFIIKAELTSLDYLNPNHSHFLGL